MRCVLSGQVGSVSGMQSLYAVIADKFRVTQAFQPFSSHGTQKRITKTLHYIKNIFFTDLTKNGYNFDSFTPDGYCCVGCFHFFI